MTASTKWCLGSFLKKMVSHRRDSILSLISFFRAGNWGSWWRPGGILFFIQRRQCPRLCCYTQGASGASCRQRELASSWSCPPCLPRWVVLVRRLCGGSGVVLGPLALSVLPAWPWPSSCLQSCMAVTLKLLSGLSHICGPELGSLSKSRLGAADPRGMAWFSSHESSVQ